MIFIGAGPGSSIGHATGGQVDLFAGIGFVVVFAGASTIMGIELFGSGKAVYIATGCFLANVFSGQSGICLSQRVGVPKIDHGLVPLASASRVGGPQSIQFGKSGDRPACPLRDARLRRRRFWRIIGRPCIVPSDRNTRRDP
ncbi:hypothetical protein [Antarcticirhabdus aurantiaca]|uniref:hypothetical protein n=1 Tax=Antarcticirhabdus aurantiaca TaxID=2606717 RepID=UPI00131C14BD